MTTITSDDYEDFLRPTERLDRDLIKALKAGGDEIGLETARCLVAMYYNVQEQRKQSGNRISAALRHGGDPGGLVKWFHKQNEVFEAQISRAIKAISNQSEISQWAAEVVGMGEVLAVGLWAYIDMDIATTVSKIWRFAGLDPTCKWEKGQKRPFNPDLKVLCWKISDSFVKVSNRLDSYYGRIYRERKEFEILRDGDGYNKPAAKENLAWRKKKNKKTSAEWRAILESGRLPALILDLRARRYASKRFLSHYWEVAYELHHRKKAPRPYVEVHLGHTDIVSAAEVKEYERVNADAEKQRQKMLKKEKGGEE
ncbi:MAG: hypothetical protein JSW58_08620 [Candidatus Latescibacterota bacterium]|nr:MAG: hypothetical protein JSW58_08620 [Candidatus Latescibacterota bacterium]